MQEIQDIIRQAFRSYHEHVEKRMAEIPVGAFLCVHEDTVQSPKLDDWKITFTVESHIVSSDLECTMTKRRTVYGPKTAEMQELYDRKAGTKK